MFASKLRTSRPLLGGPAVWYNFEAARYSPLHQHQQQRARAAVLKAEEGNILSFVTHTHAQDDSMAGGTLTGDRAQLLSEAGAAVAVHPEESLNTSTSTPTVAENKPQETRIPAEGLGWGALDLLNDVDVDGSRSKLYKQQSQKRPAPSGEYEPAKRTRDAPVLISASSGRIEDMQVFANGALLVDKPATWTSFDVCNLLKRLLRVARVKKVGHAGTLDPFATGLLIVCTGGATKSIQEFVALQKTYTGVIRLGEGTPSDDPDTNVSERKPWEHVTDAQLEAAAKEFTGDLQQTPPMYSAAHKDGERLYNLARQGITVEREAKAIHVASFELWRNDSTCQDVDFKVICSKGTYVRTLAHDIGEHLGTVAHLKSLRREAIGEHNIRDAWNLDRLVQALKAKREAKQNGV